MSVIALLPLHPRGLGAAARGDPIGLLAVPRGCMLPCCYVKEAAALFRRAVKPASMPPGVEHVRVVNSTPEQDGTSQEYWLRVHPELRPLLRDGQLGEPQQLTAHNAVASTFGLRGEQYAPEVQT